MAPKILGTRGSPLALWQARHVAARLQEVHAGLAVELRIIKTEGDQRTDVPLGSVGGKGIFVREIEEALSAGTIDLAVHSLKDLPTEQPPDLAIAAVLERHDPRDALLSVQGLRFEDLPRGTVVATGSPRRRSQLLNRRPDLLMTLVRGNVDTRVRKLKEGQFGAMVLAVAGVERLGISAVPLSPIPVEVCIPAVGQGAIAVETRSGDGETRHLLAPLSHEPTLRAVSAERAFLQRLGGGCLAPAAAHAEVAADTIRIRAMVGDLEGRRLLRGERAGDASHGEALGEALASALLEEGGEVILRELREAESEKDGR